MCLRQVPRDEIQRHDLRPLRSRGVPFAGPPQADGPHRAGRAGRAHLVLQGDAQPPGHLLDMKTTSLERIIYFQDYVVVVLATRT